VNAARVLDQVLFVAEANLTSRVELMASLDALRVAGCGPQVVLVDGGTYVALRPDSAPPARARSSARIDPVPLVGGRPTEPDDEADVVVVVEGDPRLVMSPLVESTPPVSAAPAPMFASAPVPTPVPAPTPVVEAEPVPPRSAGEPSSPLRTVEVLEAAARAQAETTIEATLVDTVPMDRSEIRRPPMRSTAPEPTSPVARAPAPTPAPAPVPAPAPTPAPAAPARHPGPEERTTELTVDTGRLPEWASSVDEEDLLRTTVQMSVFSDELDHRAED